MKVAYFNGPYSVETREVPDPHIENPTDVIVRVLLACVCGSDLWYYRGLSEHQKGSIGHEFIGVVVEAGSDVKNIKPGNFVIAPFAYSDGDCPHCQAHIYTACVNGGYFGSGSIGDGGQAQYVRVPYADGTLVTVEGAEEFSNELYRSVLTLSDVASTGYHAAVCARVSPGHTVAIVGDGAVGLCSILASRILGAKRVILLASKHEPRHILAKEFGADDIITDRGQDGVHAVMELLKGVGADAVLECVGDRVAYETAFAIARPGSMVGRVGVPHDVHINASDTFAKNIGMQGGPAPAKAYIPLLLRHVLEGNITPGKVFDFITDIDHVSDAYEAMHQRRAIKSLIEFDEFT